MRYILDEAIADLIESVMSVYCWFVHSWTSWETDGGQWETAKVGGYGVLTRIVCRKCKKVWYRK